MFQTRSQPAVVVDPYSSGSGLAPGFRSHGVASVAVLSTPEVPAVVQRTWRPTDFAHLLFFDGDLDRLAQQVGALRPRCVVAGAESGVELADALANRVVPGQANVLRLSGARRDKYLMGMALREAGVRHLRQVSSDRPEEIEAWIRANQLSSDRLVVKPPKSAGTEDVYLVGGGEEWRPYFDRILGKVNLVGVRNDAVLVQEFAAGTEYIVDTYSADGAHGLVDVCRYTKETRDQRIGIYACVEFLSPDAPEVASLFEYTREVLDAVGIRNGPAHAEVMMTADGPVLIEVGARPAGGAHQDLSREATGDCQVDRCVRHYVFGEVPLSYALVRHVRAAFLSSPRVGSLRNAGILDAVDRLPTFHSKHLPYATGDRVPATLDFFTTIGRVVLTGEDEAQVRADYAAVKRLEAQLQVEPLTAGSIPRPEPAGV